MPLAAWIAGLATIMKPAPVKNTAMAKKESARRNIDGFDGCSWTVIDGALLGWLLVLKRREQRGKGELLV